MRYCTDIKHTLLDRKGEDRSGRTVAVRSPHNFFMHSVFGLLLSSQVYELPPHFRRRSPGRHRKTTFTVRSSLSEDTEGMFCYDADHVSFTKSAVFSALMFTDGTRGIIEASDTLSCLICSTRREESATTSGSESGPILQVPDFWNFVKVM